MKSAMMGGERPVRESMTPVPHAVTVDQSVADACTRMRTLGVRHLPVQEEGKLIGILTERALAPLVEHGQADPTRLTVGDVVARDEYWMAGPETPLIAVVQSMADRGVDCCAIVDDGQLAGILTTQDTLRILVGALYDGGGQRVTGLRPSDVRARILSEHRVLRGIYEATADFARRVLDEDGEAEEPLRDHSRDLYQTLLRHIELENAILAPALYETDAYGPLRAAELLREHRRQREVLLAALDATDTNAARELARSVTQLIDELIVDMAHEERALLHPDLLKDDPITVDANSG